MHSYWFLMEQGLDRLEDARAVRQIVFMEEQGLRDELDEIDPITRHLVVYVENTSVTAGRILPSTGGEYIIGRIAVIRPYRDESFGRIVMESLENQAHALGAQAVILTAQAQAHEFYKSLGYQADGEVFLEEHYPYVWMKKSWLSTEPRTDSLDNTQHTAQNWIRSPIYNDFRKTER